MEWDNLRFMLAIHRRGSMQAAAEELSVDRATVLRRLSALEKELGVRLFDRRRDGCRITPAGLDIVSEVEGIETAMTALAHRVTGRDAVAEGTVSLTLPEFFVCAVLAPALPRLRATHPGVTVRIASGHAFLNLARGEADIALRNRVPDQTTLVARKVGTVGIGLFASRSYLAQHGPLSDGFAGHDFLLFDETLSGMPGFAWIEERLAGATVAMRSNEIMPLLAAARAGAGIAYIPAIVAHGEPDLVPVGPGMIGRPDIYLITHRELLATARVRAVFDFMVALCRERRADLAGQVPEPAHPASPQAAQA